MIKTNGINMHIEEAGNGPLVLLLHGFPELSHSWRHQMQPLADAGYRVVAPDLRGYGKTDSPKEIDTYDMLNLTADVVGLIDALGEQHACVVGHDFGAILAQHCALLRPDIFKALVLLSVPYTPRRWGDMPPTDVMKQMLKDKTYYINYFQEPEQIEKELEENIRNSMLKMLYAGSGSASPEERMSLFFKPGQRFIDQGKLPETLPDWLTSEDLETYTEMFTSTGFTGPVNYYRSIDNTWRKTAFLTQARILQPTLFIEGENDAVRLVYPSAHKTMKKFIPNLADILSLENVGHWIQQEAPETVNETIINFLLYNFPKA